MQIAGCGKSEAIPNRLGQMSNASNASETILNRNVKSLNEQDTAQFAARVMRDANIGFLPVCGASGKVVGAVTDRDIVVRLAADSGNMTTTVSTLMSRDIVACNPKDDLRRAQMHGQIYGSG